MDKQVDVIILGGGPSGLTAAIYTGRARLSTLVLAGSPPGGQLMGTADVENFPGFSEAISGPKLVAEMRKQAEKFGAEIVDENATFVSGSFADGFKVKSENGGVYRSRAVIVATGASAKWLNVPGEQKLRCKGVSACAVCDGLFFTGKKVAVVGGGNAALEEALYLTKYVSSVVVLVRGTKEEIKASRIMQEKAFNHPKLAFMFNTEVVEVLGEERVAGLKVKNNLDGFEKVLSEVEGLFVAIGHKPNTDFLSVEGTCPVDLGKAGYVVPKAGTQTYTQTPGLFVAGDVSDWKYRQAITAAGFGCMAAIDCERFLFENS